MKLLFQESHCTASGKQKRTKKHQAQNFNGEKKLITLGGLVGERETHTQGERERTYSAISTSWINFNKFRNLWFCMCKTIHSFLFSLQRLNLFCSFTNKQVSWNKKKDQKSTLSLVLGTFLRKKNSIWESEFIEVFTTPNQTCWRVSTINVSVQKIKGGKECGVGKMSVYFFGSYQYRKKEMHQKSKPAKKGEDKRTRKVKIEKI